MKPTALRTGCGEASQSPPASFIVAFALWRSVPRRSFLEQPAKTCLCYARHLPLTWRVAVTLGGGGCIRGRQCSVAVAQGQSALQLEFGVWSSYTPESVPSMVQLRLRPRTSDHWKSVPLTGSFVFVVLFISGKVCLLSCLPSSLRSMIRSPQ